MRNFLLAATLLVAAPLAAQTGTSTWSMTVEVPDSLQMMTQGVTQFDMRMIVGTDGKRIGMQIEPGPQMLARSTSTDLSGARFQAILNATGDTVSLGLVLPPAMAGMMGGGGIGYRLDLPLDSLTLPTGAVDSLEERMADSIRVHPEDTGERDTVAGIACEEWRTVDDSTGGTMTMCMAAQPAGLKAISDVLKGHFPKFERAMAKMAAEMRAEFGGRELMPIRMVMRDGQRMRAELLSVSDAAPDPSFFTLPLDLQPFPLAMVQGMMSAARQQAEQQQEPQNPEQ